MSNLNSIYRIKEKSDSNNMAQFTLDMMPILAEIDRLAEKHNINWIVASYEEDSVNEKDTFVCTNAFKSPKKLDYLTGIVACYSKTRK